MQVYIDVNDVVELRSHLVTDDNLVVGAGMTITDAIDIVSKTATIEGFGYFKRLAAHMEVIGNVAVRNVSAHNSQLYCCMNEILHRYCNVKCCIL